MLTQRVYIALKIIYLVRQTLHFTLSADLLVTDIYNYTVKSRAFVQMFKFNTRPLGRSPMVTMETFDLGVSFYGNEHGTLRGAC